MQTAVEGSLHFAMGGDGGGGASFFNGTKQPIFNFKRYISEELKRGHFKNETV